MKTISFLFLFPICLLSKAQNLHNRLRSEYTVKEIDTAGINKISIGEVFLDKNQRNLSFYQEFPEVKQTKLKDTILSTYQNDTLSASISVGKFFDMTIYNLILSSKLDDFGLKGRGYKLVDIKTIEEGKLVSTYAPKDSSTFGKVDLVLNSSSKLDLVIVYLPGGKMVSKTFLMDYKVQKGISIPYKIIQFAYLEDKVAKKVTTLRNVIIDEEGNSDKYIH